MLSYWKFVSANQLSLNYGKPNFVIFHSYEHKAYYDVNLKIYENNLQKSIPLERKNYVNYLGVLIDLSLIHIWRCRRS